MKKLIFYLKKKKNILEPLSACLAVVAFYAFLQCIGITCPVKFVTGISCAGCGMTRAWMALLHLDFSKAVYYHPLFWLPPVALVIFACRKRMNQKVYKILMFTMAVVFVIVYICRLVKGNNEIVVFQPQKSAIIQFAEFIQNYGGK